MTELETPETVCPFGMPLPHPAPVLPCWYCDGKADGEPYDPRVHHGWACEACDERRKLKDEIAWRIKWRRNEKTANRRARNEYRDNLKAVVGQRDLLRVALSTLLAWDEQFQFCNVDETGDTPCICHSHPMTMELDHDATCEKYRKLVRSARALITDGSLR